MLEGIKEGSYLRRVRLEDLIHTIESKEIEEQLDFHNSSFLSSSPSLLEDSFLMGSPILEHDETIDLASEIGAVDRINLQFDKIKARINRILQRNIADNSDQFINDLELHSVDLQKLASYVEKRHRTIAEFEKKLATKEFNQNQDLSSQAQRIQELLEINIRLEEQNKILRKESLEKSSSIIIDGDTDELPTFDELQAELQTTKNTCVRLFKENDTLNATLKSEQQKSKQLNSEVIELTAQLNELLKISNSEQKDYQNQIKKIEDRLVSPEKKEYVRAFSTEVTIESLQNEVQTLRKELGTERDFVLSLKSEIIKLKNSNDRDESMVVNQNQTLMSEMNDILNSDLLDPDDQFLNLELKVEEGKKLFSKVSQTPALEVPQPIIQVVETIKEWKRELSIVKICNIEQRRQLPQLTLSVLTGISLAGTPILQKPALLSSGCKNCEILDQRSKKAFLDIAKLQMELKESKQKEMLLYDQLTTLKRKSGFFNTSPVADKKESEKEVAEKLRLEAELKIYETNALSLKEQLMVADIRFEDVNNQLYAANSRYRDLHEQYNIVVSENNSLRGRIQSMEQKKVTSAQVHTHHEQPKSFVSNADFNKFLTNLDIVKSVDKKQENTQMKQGLRRI